MKTLVVYYSRTGTTKKVGEKLAEKLDADIEEIIDLKSRKGVLGFLGAGRDAIRKKPTEIKKPEKNAEDYGLVIIGTPVWAGTIVPAIRTYITTRKISKVAFFTTSGSISTAAAFSELSRIMQKKPAASLALQTAEVRQGADSKISFFIENIKNS